MSVVQSAPSGAVVRAVVTDVQRSYRGIRLAVGILGIVLPFVLILGECLRDREMQVRGSLSAYYHSPVRDVFVGGLCIVGFLLATYTVGTRRRDFWVSLVAGVAVLGVVFFPTGRATVPSGQECGRPPIDSGCAFTADLFGETPTAHAHAVFAVVFILFLAVMSAQFAADSPTPALRRLHRVCAWSIGLAGSWAVVGSYLHLDLGDLTPLYLGEVGSVWSFGVSWLTAALSLGVPAEGGPGSVLETDAPTGSGPVSWI